MSTGISCYLFCYQKCWNLTLKLTRFYRQFMLTINLLFILRKSVNYSVNQFSNRNMNSTIFWWYWAPNFHAVTLVTLYLCSAVRCWGLKSRSVCLHLKSQDGQAPRFTHIAAMYSELVAIDLAGRLCQWRWSDPEPFSSADVRSSMSPSTCRWLIFNGSVAQFSTIFDNIWENTVQT